MIATTTTPETTQATETYKVKAVNPKTGETVYSQYTDRAAIEKIANGKSEFGRDLAAKREQYGRLSDAQWFWVHKLANEKPREQVDLGAEFESIAAIFENAADKIKFPKINFQLPEGQVTLSRCGSRSKYTGAINVTDGGKYGENTWYGRIEKDGKFTTGRSTQGWVVKFLQKFAADPAGTAAEYGQNSGHCCFCNRELTDERSTSVGYGKTCANNYALPWG